MTRFIAVDIETTGLDVLGAWPIEVAAAEIGNGLVRCCAPHIPKVVMADAEPQALQVNRYYERGVWADQLDDQTTREWAAEFCEWFDGAYLVGANPAFDAAVLGRWLRYLGFQTPWHYRLLDVEAMTMAALSLDAPPSLSKCAAHWNIEVQEPKHSAMADALTTANVFEAIQEWMTLSTQGTPTTVGRG